LKFGGISSVYESHSVTEETVEFAGRNVEVAIPWRLDAWVAIKEIVHSPTVLTQWETKMESLPGDIEILPSQSQHN